MARNVLVTGSSHGIGAAIAEAFAKEGCNVGVTYCKTPEGAEATAEACRKYGVDVQIFKVDLHEREQCVKLMADFLEHFKTIDVLINNAGGALKMPKGEFVDMPLDYWDSQIALNLNAAAYCTQAAIRNMKENGIKGRIVNISSIHSKLSWVRRKMLPYCGAKAGLEGFTRSIATEVAKYGITVNCVAPGLVLTKIADRYSKRDLEGFQRKIACGFLGTPKDIVPAVLFLADVEKSAYIVGQTLHIDGGMSVDGVIDCMMEDEF